MVQIKYDSPLYIFSLLVLCTNFFLEQIPPQPRNCWHSRSQEPTICTYFNTYHYLRRLSIQITLRYILIPAFHEPPYLPDHLFLSGFFTKPSMYISSPSYVAVCPTHLTLLYLTNRMTACVKNTANPCQFCIP